MPIPDPRTTRRQLLLGGIGGVALACAGCSPSRTEQAATRLGGSGPRSSGGAAPRLTVVDRTREGSVDTWTLSTPSLPDRFQVRVILPPDYDTASAKRYPVLYLLHGSGSSSATWFQDERLTAPLRDRDAIVVLPDGGDQGWYLDWAQPEPPVRWESVHVLGIAPEVDRSYRTIAGRAARGLAGISMGGFGALHYAQAYPDRFAAVSSFSGAVSLRRPRDFGAMDAEEMDGKPAHAIFGTTDVAASVARVDPVENAAALARTRVRLYCGDGGPQGDTTEQAMLGANRLLEERLRQAGVDVRLTVGPGAHDSEQWAPLLAREVPALLSALTPAR